MGDDDSPGLHFEDTLAAGDGLCEPDAVRALVEEGPAYVSELLDWGARFDRHAGWPAGADARGGPQRPARAARRGRHRARDQPRAARAGGRAAGHHDHRSRDRHRAAVRGRALRRGGVSRRAATQRHEVRAGATLLATGGAGQVFAQTTNPTVTTGDGMAMAFEAGAEVADLEFVQFHPTVLDVPGRPRFLLSEALRGEGARLLNAAGEAFMARYEEAAELAPRDRVARAIVRERQRTGAPIYLSLAHLTDLDVHGRFPQISEACREAGLDLARDPVPVSPAVHYVMGGVVTDLDGRTSMPGLYAAGEVACTGVHGANRLASNSLLEGLVFGARAGAVMGEAPRGRAPWGPGRLRGVRSGRARAARDAHRRTSMSQTVRARAWRDLGLVRTPEGLHEADAWFSRARAACVHDAGRDPGRGAVAQPGHRRLPDEPRGTPPRREPRRPLPYRFSRAPRRDVGPSLQRRAAAHSGLTTTMSEQQQGKGQGQGKGGGKGDAFVTAITSQARGLLTLVPRRRAARGTGRLHAGPQGLHDHPAVRLRDLGAHPAAARRAAEGDRTRQRLLPAVHPREPADEGGRARRGLRAGGGLGHARRQGEARGDGSRSVRPPRSSSGRCTPSGCSRGATCPS